MQTNQQIGLCKVCGKEIYEITARHQDGPLAGEVLSVGKPYDWCRTVTYLLNSGACCDITACDECAEQLRQQPVMVIAQWKEVILAYYRELQDDFRIWQGQRPFTPEQKQAQIKYIAEQFPIGVLCVRRTSDG